MNKIICFAVLLLLAGCTQDAIVSVTPVLVAKGTLYGSGDSQMTRQNMVISSVDEWRQLQAKMNLVSKQAVIALEDTIDFAQYTVLAIFDVVQMNIDGNPININIMENNKNVYVEIVYNDLEPHSLLTIRSYPYLIVKIPRTSKKIIFSSNNS